jgi:hypothetical protein
VCAGVHYFLDGQEKGGGQGQPGYLVGTVNGCSSAGIGRIWVQSNEMNRGLSDDSESYTRDPRSNPAVCAPSVCLCVSVDYQESRSPVFFLSLSFPFIWKIKMMRG